MKYASQPVPPTHPRFGLVILPENSNTGVLHVRTMSYPTKQEARNALSTARGSEYAKGAWTLVKARLTTNPKPGHFVGRSEMRRVEPVTAVD